MTDLAIRDDLTPVEVGRLVQLESVVEQGRQTFVDVGSALMEIRDARLYRQTHDSFEGYCRDRWGFSKTQANRLVQASSVVAALTPTGATPQSERQARELAPLLGQPDQLREAWDEASTNGAPTAATVREAVQRRTLVVPIDEALLAQQQRDTLIFHLDKCVRGLESTPSMARGECERLLRDGDGDPGPFLPSRFDKVIAYATAFAQTLREAGIDG